MIPLQPAGCVCSFVRSPLPWNAEYDYLHLGTQVGFKGTVDEEEDDGIFCTSQLLIHPPLGPSIIL